MKNTALFIGRFQPFHFGHLDAIKQILDKCDRLYIAIGSSNKSGTVNNPLKLNDRLKLIKDTLEREGIQTKLISFFEVPDFNNDKKWTNFILNIIPKFSTVYAGNTETLEYFKKTHNTFLLDIRLDICATKIRKMIQAKDNKWKNWTYLDEEKAKEIK